MTILPGTRVRLIKEVRSKRPKKELLYPVGTEGTYVSYYQDDLFPPTPYPHYVKLDNDNSAMMVPLSTDEFEIIQPKKADQ